MTYSEICEQYIELIKKYDDPVMLDRVLKKNNYELNYECMNDLSALHDYLDDNSGFDERMELKFQKEYGWCKEYHDQQDKAWSELTEDMQGAGLI